MHPNLKIKIQIHNTSNTCRSSLCIKDIATLRHYSFRKLFEV